MKALLKRSIAVALALSMLMSVTVFAAPIATGSNGNTVYISTNATDKKQGSQITQVSNGKTFVVELNFVGNPTEKDKTIQNYNLFVKYDTNKMSYVNFLDGLTNPQKKDNGGTIVLGWASTEGITKQNEETYENEIQSQGCLGYIVFRATTDLDASDLNAITFVQSYGNDVTKMGECSVVVAPSLGVADSTQEFYVTDTVEEIGAKIGEVTYVDVTGSVTTVNKSNVTIMLPTGGLVAGENTLTASYNGVSCEFTIMAQAVAVTGLEVATKPQLSYTSGDQLNLNGMVVNATYNNGKKQIITNYTTNYTAGTSLTVANHNGKELTVTADGKTAIVGSLVVEPKSIAIPTAIGSYVYNGTEQNFTVGNDTDANQYTVTGNQKGTDAGEYTATATLKDITETKWSDGTTAAKTLKWTISPNTDRLTVSVTGTYTYNGSAQTPTVTVKSGDKSLIAEQFEITCKDNTNAGTATVTVTGKGNYGGATGTATFQIARKTIAESDFSKLPVDTKVYTGQGITQDITTTLTSSDYKVDYSNNVNAGTAKYTITGLGNYTGSFEKTFTISKANWNKSITGSVNIYYRSTTAGSFEASSLVNAPAGAAFTGQAMIPGNEILAANSVQLDNGKLVYTPTGTASSGKSVVVEVPVSSTNYNDATAKITFTTVDINIPWPAESSLTIKANPVYGDTNADILKGFATGTVTATAAGNVTGKFSVKNAAERPAAGTTSVTLVFTPDAGQSITTPFEHQYTITAVAKKSVTINGVTAQDKVYDGNTSTTPDNSKVTIVGNLDGENLKVSAGTAAFTNKNAGTNKTVTFTGYALSGSATGNYVLSDQPASVKANITQKELTVGAGTLKFTKEYNGKTDATNPTGALTLTGVVSGDTVSIANGYTAAYADANAGNNKNVELTGLTLTGTDAGNYKLKETTLTVTGNSITKATWDKTTATSSAKYGTTGTLDLSQYLVSDATIDDITTTDNNSVLNGTPSVAEKTLSYQFKNDANLKDKTATITISVTSGNYENYNITVTVTVLDKLTQDNFKFAENTQTKTYGDSKFTYAATGAVAGSTVTYSSSEPTVATVDETTGEVTILKAGTTVITATATATDDYAAATQTYTLTVNKAKLTVRPKSYTIRVGETLPTPGVEYVGLKNDDKADEVAKLATGKLDLEIKNADKTGALENSSTTGTYEIVFKETPTFQYTENYDIEVGTGTLTIDRRSSGSGGNSGVSTSPVSVTTPKNGKVSVNPSNAAKGATVTVTVTPDSGYEMDKLTVTDASGKSIPTTDKGNGKFTFTMPNGKVSVTATFKQTSVTPSTGFVDVPASAYYADAVKWAVEQGITTGTSATTFSPEASCTRAQMVTFLWRAAGSPAPKATTTALTDLDKSAYYYDAVLWAVEQGITTGTSATTFSPNATVTRGQTVTFLYRFAGQPAVSGSSSFADVNSSDYYAAAVQWAKEQGITSGTSATTFSPKSNCTRGQIVTFLYRQLAK